MQQSDTSSPSINCPNVFSCSIVDLVLWWYGSHPARFLGNSHRSSFPPVYVFYDNVVMIRKLLLFSKCHFQVYSNSKAEAFTQTFLKRSLEHQSKFDLKDLSHRALILEYPRHKRDASASKHKKAKGLNAQQKRKNNIYQIKPEHQRLVMISGINVSLL